MQLDELPEKLFAPVIKSKWGEEIGLSLIQLDSGEKVLYVWSTDTPLRIWAHDREYNVEPLELGKTYLIATALAGGCEYLVYNYNIVEKSIAPERLIMLKTIQDELDKDYIKRIQFYQSWLREVKDLLGKIQFLYRQDGKLTAPLNLELLNLMGISKIAGNFYDSTDDPTEEEELIFEKIEEVVDKSLVLFKEVKPNLGNKYS